MKKNLIIFLSVILSLFWTQSSYAQCPTGTVTASVSSTANTCAGNGTVTVDFSPTTGLLLQLFKNGSLLRQISPTSSPYTWNNLQAGNDYQVKVICTDDNSVVYQTLNVTVADNYVPISTADISVSNVCTNFTTEGTLTVNSVTGGNAPYQYSAYLSNDPSYDDALSSYGNSNTINVSAAGTYQIRVKDACGNYKTFTRTINPNIDKIVVNWGVEKVCNSNMINAQFSGGYQGNQSIGSSYLQNNPIILEIYEANATNDGPQGSALYNATYSGGTFTYQMAPSHKYWVKTTNSCGLVNGYLYNAVSLEDYNFYVSQSSSGCGASEQMTITGSIPQYFTYPITVTIKNSSGGIVQTLSLAKTDSGWTSNPLPMDSYTVTFTDACGVSRDQTVTNPQSAGTPILDILGYVNFACSDVGGAATQTGTVQVLVGVSGYLPDRANAVIKIISGPSNVGQIAFVRNDQQWVFNNMLPGNYMVSIITSCGGTNTYPMIVNPSANDLLQQSLTSVGNSFCSGGGNILSTLVYNGNFAHTVQLFKLPNLTTPIDQNSSGNFYNLSTGTYVTKLFINPWCGNGSYNYTIEGTTVTVTLTDSSTGPQITSSVGVVCEDSAGNPLTTGTAYLDLAGVAPFKIEYKKTSETTWTEMNNAPANTSLSGLTANTLYDVRLTDACGGSFSTTVNVKTISVLTSENTVQPCYNSPYTLSSKYYAGATYEWKNPQGTVVSNTRTYPIANYTAANNGTYICKITWSNCVTRYVYVTVNGDLCGAPLGILDAIDDDFSSTPLSTSGGIAGDLTNNDLFDVNPVDDSTINITLNNNGGITGATIDANGNLIVPAGTPQGTYTVTYTICLISSPTTCDTATAIVVINDTMLDAVLDINQTPINVPVSGNVITNDEFTGTATVTSAQFYNASGVLTNLPIGTATPVFTPAGVPAGTMLLNANGTYTYTPATGFVGEIPVNYTLTNNLGSTDSTTLTIKVIPNTVVGNDNPIAQHDTSFTEEGVSVSSTVLNNDSDPDGDALTVTSATGLTIGTATVVSGVNAAGTPVANAGTVQLNANGTYTYVPAAGFVGTVNPLPYVISDGNGGTATANIYITVVGAGSTTNNTFANDDANSAPKGVTMTDNVKTNDTDPEGNTTTVTAATVFSVNGVANGTALTIGTATVIPGVGSVTLNANGTYSFVPVATYVGTVVIPYTICDNGVPQACYQAKLELTSLDVVDSIDAVLNINQTPINVPVSGNVITNDEFTGTATVTSAQFYNASGVLTNLPIGTATPVFTPAGVPAGTMLLNANGTYTYTPATGFVGEIPVNYTLTNNLGSTDSTTLTIKVIPNTVVGNDNPIAQHDTSFTEEGVSVSSTVLNNDSDPDGDALTVTSATGLTIGTATVVSGVNAAGTPVANAGTVQLNANGTYTYVPAAGFVGTVNPLPYVISDGNGGTATANIYITVVGAGSTTNNTFANDDANSAPKGVTMTGNVKTNDTDPEGNTTTVTAATVFSVNGVANGTALTIGTATVIPGVGSVTLNANGTYSFVPVATYVGTVVIPYTICDNGVPQACYQAKLELTSLDVVDSIDAVLNINQTPINVPVSGNVITNDEFTGTATVTSAQFYNASGVLTNLPIGTATPVFTPAGVPAGTMLLNANGTYTYTPATGFVGEIPVNYTLTNNLGSTDSTTLTIKVIPNTVVGNDNPIAQHDTSFTEEGVSVSSTVLNNDSDPDGDALTVTSATGLTIGTATVVSGVNAAGTPVANAGTVQLNANGTYTYVPAAGFVGTVNPLPYVISDGNGGTATANIYITVVGAGSTTNNTFANDDANSAPKGVTMTGNVKTNDTDPEGNTTTVTAATVFSVNGVANGTALTIGTATVIPGVGSVTLNANGTYSFVPVATYVGTVVIPYTICDNGVPQACDTATVYLTVNPANTTHAINDIKNTYVDTPVSGNVLTNDFDVEGHTQTVTPSNTTTAEGTLVLNADGTYTFTPATGFEGTFVHSYTVCDNGIPQSCDTATLTIEVMPSPNEPGTPNDVVANNDTATTPGGQPVTIDVLANDFDPNGDTLGTPTVVTPPTNGTFDPTTGVYTPNPGFEGVDTFTYQVCDNGTPQACDTAVVTINVVPVTTTNATYANDDSYNGDQYQPINGSVLDNDTDPEGNTQTVSSNTQPQNGTVVMQPDGTFVYTPTGEYSGPDQFTYTVCDNGTPPACDTATVYLTVNPANTTHAINDIKNTYVDTPVSGNVLTNDFDVEGHTQTVTPSNTTTAEGTLVLNADGTYTFTPATGFEGTFVHSYTVCDNGIPQSCDTATLTIEVMPSPNEPGTPNDVVANNDTATTPGGQPVTIDVLANDFDPNGDTLGTPTVVTPPTNGTFDPTTGVYTPNPGFEGVDTFTYQVCDNGTPQACDTAVVTINVVPVTTTNATYANDDSYNGDQYQPINGSVLDNDTDPEGNTQTVSSNTQPQNGTVVMQPDGTFVYTPTGEYSGPDQFTYTVCDNGTPPACDTATVYLTVNPANTTHAINDINNTYVDTPVSGNVLTNDFDVEGHTQTVTPSNTTTAEGTLVLNADGTYTFTPATGFEGTFVHSYTVCDNGIPQSCDTATLTIEVMPSPNEPGTPNDVVANNDTATTPGGQPVTIDVLANDFDPNGDTLGTPTVVTPPTNGTFDPTTGVYTPNPGFEGVDTFTYQVCDNGTPQACDTAVVTINVVPVTTTNATYANDDSYNGDQYQPINGSVLDNDTDPEGNTQTVSSNTQPQNGTVVMQPDGTFVYTPTGEYSGPDQFTYTVCDNGTPPACDTATVYLTVNPANTTHAINDINNTYVDTPVSGNVLTNDYDVEGHTQTVTPSNTTTAEGTLVLNADGTYTFTPATGFEGTFVHSYTVCDNGIPQSCDTATLTIEVMPSPNEPGTPNDVVANNDTATTPGGQPVTIDVLANDFDPNGDTLGTPTVVTPPTNGTFDPTTGVYTPNPGFEGVDTFTYQVCDNGTPQACDTAVVTINVVPVTTTNATYANDDSYNGDQYQPINGSVLDNDTDPEGNTQTVSSNTQPQNGTVVMQPDGTFVYTPTGEYSGPDQFTYTVCDNGTPPACDTATVYLTVNPANTTHAINDINNTYVDTPVSGNVLTNDFDVEGHTQTVTPSNTTTAEGTLVLNADGTYTFTPATGFEGTFVHSYTVCDNGIPQSCDTATLTIEVMPSPNEPGTPNDVVANNDTATTPGGQPVTIDVLANDFDPNGDTLGTPTVVTPPTNGTFDPTTGVYTPNPGFEGVDTFTYQVCDNGTPQACDTAVVTINVVPVTTTNATYANDDSYNGDQYQPINGSVLDNDTDPEGSTQTVSSNTQPQNGTVVMQPDGTFVYTPTGEYSGPDQFTYTVCDNGTPPACDTATVYLTVNPANTTHAINDINNTYVDTPVSGNVLTNDFDVEGHTQTVTPSNTTTAEGTLVLNADGTYTFTPATGFEGTFVHSYTVCDNGIPQSCDTAIVTINVEQNPTDTNNSVVANNDAVITEVGTPITISVLSNDFDPNGNPFTITPGSVTTPVNGTVTVNPDGTITYIPNPLFVGEDTFTYQICDNQIPQACDTATVIVTVLPLSNLNTTYAMDDSYFINCSSNSTMNLLDNDYDLESNTQTINTIPVVQPLHGTVSINSDGTFIYTVSGCYTGPDSFIYQVCDNGTQQKCDVATVYLLISANQSPVVTGTFPVANVQGCSATAAPAAVTTVTALETMGLTIADDCTPDATLVVTSADTSVGTCPIVVTRTYTITDACGNFTTATQTINVQDTTVPVVTGTITPATAEGCSATAAPVAVTTVAALEGMGLTIADACTLDATLVVTSADTSAGTCPIVVTRTYTITDTCGNFTTATQTINVQDKTAPVVTGTITPATAEGCSATAAPAAVTTVTALEGMGLTIADACTSDATLVVTSTDTSAGTCPIVVTRTYTITDACGNFTTATQTINVQDTTAPVFLGNMPSDLVLECSDLIPTVPTLIAADNCAGIPIVTFDEVNTQGSCPNAFTLTRTWTATDVCGNQTIHTQTIDVEDTTAPVFVGNLPETVIFANCDAIPEAATLTATDNCGSATVVYGVPVEVEGDCTNRKSIIRTWTATDECGNTSTFTQTVYLACYVTVYNAVSPNGDGINDEFIIEGLECYPNNTVEVYNRWGVKVYERTGYNNDDRAFRGVSEGRVTINQSEELPEGTYYYILRYKDSAATSFEKAGYLYINR